MYYYQDDISGKPQSIPHLLSQLQTFITHFSQILKHDVRFEREPGTGMSFEEIGDFEAGTEMGNCVVTITIKMIMKIENI